MMMKDTTPDLPSLARLGALLGFATALLLAVLQFAAAGLAEALWYVARPGIKLFLYPVIGALAGAMLAVGVGWLGGRFEDRRRWSLVAASLGLAGYAARGLASAWSLGRPPLLGAIVHLGVVLFFVWAVARRLEARKCGSASAARRAAMLLMAATLTAAVYMQLVVFGDRFLLTGVPWLLRIGLLELLGVVGVAAGLGMFPQAGSASSRWWRLAGSLILIGFVGHTYLTLRQEPTVTGTAKPPAEAPNVLVVVLDTLRRDAVSAYEVVAGTTPNLDRLAAEGTLWEDAIVPGNWTIPGHASLFTGAVVSRHGAGHGRKILERLPAGEGTLTLPTLAETFRSRGWLTAAFVCNGQLSSRYGYDRGFERYHELWRARKGDFDLLGRLIDGPLGLAPNDRGGELTVRGLRSFLRSDSARESPWFVFVNFLEPHAPYDPPLPWTGMFSESIKTRAEARRLSELTESRKYGGASVEEMESLWQIYLNAVAYQDHLFGRLMDDLQSAGLDERTIVLVTSDHGENFGWRGQLSHGIDLNDDLIRVPLVARGPGIPVGRRDPSPVSVVDVFPSLMYLTGGEPASGDPGRPGIVLPALQDTAVAGDRPRLAEKLPDSPPRSGPLPEATLIAGRQALLQGDWMLIREEDSGRLRLTRRDGRPDPPSFDGRSPVDDAEVTQRLDELLAALRASWPHAVREDEEEPIEIDEETRRQLEALGYVD